MRWHVAFFRIGFSLCFNLSWDAAEVELASTYGHCYWSQFYLMNMKKLDGVFISIRDLLFDLFKIDIEILLRKVLWNCSHFFILMIWSNEIHFWWISSLFEWSKWASCIHLIPPDQFLHTNQDFLLPWGIPESIWIRIKIS